MDSLCSANVICFPEKAKHGFVDEFNKSNKPSLTCYNLLLLIWVISQNNSCHLAQAQTQAQAQATAKVQARASAQAQTQAQAKAQAQAEAKAHAQA